MIETGGLPNPLVAFDPSGSVLALGLSNSTIRLFSMKERGKGPFFSQPVNDPMRPNPPPEWTKISFSNDGKYLLISTKSNVIYLLDAFTGALLHRLTGHLNAAGIYLEASFTPDAKYVLCGKLDLLMYLSGSQDGKINCWDVKSGAKLCEWTWHSDAPRVVSFCPKYLLAASADENLALWTPPI
jgi:COMPASS component SWD2